MSETAAAKHRPVMAAEMVAALAPADGARIVDGTFGRGGHTTALLAAARCRVVAIDCDGAAIAAGETLRTEYGERLLPLRGRFGEMEHLLNDAGIDAVDGVALDLGVSSPQLDVAEHGFSFRADGPLDMRMGDDGPSAADFVNEADEDDIARVLRTLGEERRARAVARAILRARARRPIRRTGELAEIVVAAVGWRGKRHPATRAFQALRMHVNDELGELERGLLAAERLLVAGGRLAVIAFHSLEDRLVKRFFESRAGGGGRTVSRHLPLDPNAEPARFDPLFRGVRRPSDDEVAANPRARSARLRAAVRTAAPPLEPAT